MIERAMGSQMLAAQLLESYEPGSSFFFASPRRTLLARGTFATVPHPGGTDSLSRLPERVAAVLHEARQADHDIPVAVGAVPFDGRLSAQLVVPMTIQRAGPLVFEKDAAAHLRAGAALHGPARARARRPTCMAWRGR